ncbi:MAG: DUF421 domain-containing protein [Acidobacteria bacterium]|nr:DUF421 domain-containing protein [Acidobacteriota bacterium]
MWHDLFTLTIPFWEKVLRPVLVYAFLVVGLRLGGKRVLAQLNAFDLVVLLTLSNTVQNAIIGADNSLIGGLIGAATLLLINYLMNRLLYVSPSADRVLEGRETVLLRKGALDELTCKRESVTRSELEAAARRQGFSSLGQVERAILEPSGTITFVGKEPSAGETRHRELLLRLEAVTSELTQLRKAMARGR